MTESAHRRPGCRSLRPRRRRRRRTAARHVSAAAASAGWPSCWRGNSWCARWRRPMSPSRRTVVMAIPRVIADPAFLTATRETLTAVAEGLAIALVFGTDHRLADGRAARSFERAIRHYINGFYAMPMIIVLPLFSLWFGYSGGTRIATIIFAAIFSIIVNVADGARSVPREFLEVARSFRSGADARPGRDRVAGVDALFAGRFPARRRPRADRRDGVGVLPLDRRTWLLHSLQLTRLSPQRGLRRRVVAGGLSASASNCW